MVNWKHPERLAALRIAGIYLAVGGLWILLSDRALVSLIGDAALAKELSWLQTLKGWFYVFVTAILVWLLVDSHLRTIKRSRDQLAASESHYRSLFDNSPIALWDVDFSRMRQALLNRDGTPAESLAALMVSDPEAVRHLLRLRRLNDVNRAGLELFEASSLQELEERLPDLVTPASLQVLGQMILALVRGNTEYLWELPARTVSGKNLVTLASIVLPPGNMETWANVQFSFIDITERKQIIAELQTHQKLLLEAERIAQAGSWEWTVGDRHMRWDLNIYRLFGLQPRTTISHREFWRHVVSEDRRPLQQVLARALAEPRKFSHTYRVTPKNGEVRTLSLSGESFVDEVSGRIKLIGWVQDITSQLKEEEERRALEAQLRHAQKMESLGALAGGIAHDFNNILTPLYGYTELALQSLPEQDPVRDDLQHVIKAAGRGKELVQQILAFSRQIEQERKPVFVHHIVKEVVKLLAATIPSNIHISTQIDSQMGAVIADPVQIHQVIMNLCVNAAYAMKEAGGVLTLELDTVAADDSTGGCVRLRVRDTGCGMNSETLARIFEPFFTTKPAGVGTGLGLSVTKQIILDHGGTIEVESTPGAGTTFTIRLPLAPSAPVSENADELYPARAHERILFVDDEPEIVGMAQQMLLRLGYQAETCHSADDALRRIRAGAEFDLIISDQNMAGTTGLQLALALRALDRRTPIVLMTSDGIRFSEEFAHRHGVTDCLTKPFSAFDLSQIIHRVLEARRNAASVRG